MWQAANRIVMRREDATFIRTDHPIPPSSSAIYRLLFGQRFPHTIARTSCDDFVRHPAGRLRKILRRDIVSFPVS